MKRIERSDVPPVLIKPLKTENPMKRIERREDVVGEDHLIQPNPMKRIESDLAVVAPQSFYSLSESNEKN